MHGIAFWAHGAPMSLSWCRAQAERVSAAARAQAALPGAVEIYYLPAAKGSSALNYAPRRQQAALRSNPLRAERGESSARREAMAEMRPPLSPTSNNVKRASEKGASETSKKQRLGDTPLPFGAADQERPPKDVAPRDKPEKNDVDMTRGDARPKRKAPPSADARFTLVLVGESGGLTSAMASRRALDSPRSARNGFERSAACWRRGA